VVEVQQRGPASPGTVEVVVRGGLADAEYVRGALLGLKGVVTHSPVSVPGAVGVLVQFRAIGTKSIPLTKAMVVRAFQQDGNLEVLPGA
jgi:hypothetical protein